MLLVDSDSLLYAAGFASERTKYCITVGNEYAIRDTAKEAKELLESGYEHIWSRKELQSEEAAIQILDVMGRDIMARYPKMKAEWWLTPSVGNFREKIATRAKYKGSRDGAQKPTHFKALRGHMLNDWYAQETVGQEAEDQVSIRAHELGPDNCVICHLDKDLNQIPGLHFNYSTKEEYTVSKKEAALNFWVQVLTGDPVDNVPGIPGVGPVKARKILDGAKGNWECWRRVLEVYEKEFNAAGYGCAKEAASLVFLRTKPGEVWSAPTASKEQQDAA